MRRALLIALVAALVPCAPASAAKQVVKTKITAHVVELSIDDGTRCEEGAFLEMPDVPGSLSYEVTVSDKTSTNGRPTLWIGVKKGTMQTAYANAQQITAGFSDAAYAGYPAVAAGHHRVLLATRDCRATGLPPLTGRFHVMGAMVLTYTCASRRAAGSSCQVRDTMVVTGSARADGRGRTGVHVVARDERGHVAAQETTGRRYELRLKAGTKYEISSPDVVDGRRWCARGPSCAATVEVTDTHRGVAHRKTVDLVLGRPIARAATDTKVPARVVIETAKVGATCTAAAFVVVPNVPGWRGYAITVRDLQEKRTRRFFAQRTPSGTPVNGGDTSYVGVSDVYDPFPKVEAGSHRIFVGQETNTASSTQRREVDFESSVIHVRTWGASSVTKDPRFGDDALL